MSSFITLIAVLVGVTAVVALLSVVELRTYGERRARKRNEEVAEQVKKQLADLRNSRSPQQQQRVDQGNNDLEDTGHEAGQLVKESIGQSASQSQGTVGQDADQRRATEVEPWATFHLGSTFDRQGKCARAVEAYQQVLDSGHQEAAPRAAFNLGILFEERGRYDLAEEAYQRAIASEHAEWAPKAAFDLGMLFEEREEYDRAEEAYQQAINSGHPEVAPKGMHSLRGLPMRFPQRIRQG